MQWLLLCDANHKILKNMQLHFLSEEYYKYSNFVLNPHYNWHDED